MRCHDPKGASPILTDQKLSSLPFNRAYISLVAPVEKDRIGKYVHPGRARTSPLIWHIFGRNTSRPWDGDWASKPVKPMGGNVELSAEEKRLFVEWIDLGAGWSMQFEQENAPAGGKK